MNVIKTQEINCNKCLKEGNWRECDELNEKLWGAVRIIKTQEIRCNKERIMAR
jgi:hypothetical protein